MMNPMYLLDCRLLRKEPYLLYSTNWQIALVTLRARTVDVISDQDTGDAGQPSWLRYIEFPDTVRFMLTGKATWRVLAGHVLELSVTLQTLQSSGASRHYEGGFTPESRGGRR
jgi:hypothetical protein